MSTPITPVGPGITPTVNETATTQTTPEAPAPAVTATTATVTQALKLQEISVDKAFQQAKAGATPAEDPTPGELTETSSGTLTAADVAARQLKSVAQRQDTTSAAATTAGCPPTGTTAASTETTSQPSAPLPTLLDLWTKALGLDSVYASVAPLIQLSNPMIQYGLGALCAMQFACREWNSWTSRGEFLGGPKQTKGMDDFTAPPVLLNQFVQTIESGGKMMRVLVEQFKGSCRSVVQSFEQVKPLHTFTPDEISNVFDSLQKKGRLPAEIPDRQALTEKIAKTAQETLEDLVGLDRLSPRHRL